jgi:membrane fusion protein, copper/silver efflux system
MDNSYEMRRLGAERQNRIMKIPAKIVGLIIIVILSFLLGTWYSSRNGGSEIPSGGRKVLYWHDPMHPAYKSDKPGIAPDCGMQLEPVYADEASSQQDMPGTNALLPGTIQINQERQQLIGVKVATVERAPWNHTIRVPGRVVPDEARVYRVNSATDGWVKSLLAPTTGSLVRKDELLASFFSPEFFSAIKAYLYGLGSLDRFEKSGRETKEQIEQTNANIESYRNSLRNLGMTDHQMDEIMRTRKSPDNIEIRAPESGFILVRNISPGERFEKGTELYRIADISHVWILADILEAEGGYFRPGAMAEITHEGQRKPFKARISDVLPQFDPATRKLKVRLEANNPGFAMRPDMFVDVAFPVQLHSSLTVPSEAVLDTGLRKTVFVDRGNGYFEPRRIETGKRLGDRIEITNGLMEGDRIVISGNFLVDSESRLKLAAAGLPDNFAVDPVCGMGVNPRSAAQKIEFKGQTYYFCSSSCKDSFLKEPAKYLKTR